MRTYVALAGLLLACGDGRSRAPAPPKPAFYWVTIEHLYEGKYWIADLALEGATLVADGVEQGVLGDRITVGVQVAPGRTFDQGQITLALRLPTPCGPKDVPLPYTVAPPPADLPAASADPSKVRLRRDASVTLPGETNIYVDDERAPKAVVTFGSAKVATPNRRDDKPAKGRYQRLWDPTCAAEHAVAIDGAPVGVVKASDPAAIGVLISTDPAACYQRRVTLYGDPNQPAGRAKQFPLLRGQVNTTGWDGIAFFLERPAAGIDRGAGYGGTTSRRSLERVACPASP